MSILKLVASTCKLLETRHNKVRISPPFIELSSKGKASFIYLCFSLLERLEILSSERDPLISGFDLQGLENLTYWERDILLGNLIAITFDLFQMIVLPLSLQVVAVL